jgi:hypothetical protein
MCVCNRLHWNEDFSSFFLPMFKSSARWCLKKQRRERERKLCRIFDFESKLRAISDQKVTHQESIYLIPKSKKLKILSLRVLVAVKQDAML